MPKGLKQLHLRAFVSRKTSNFTVDTNVMSNSFPFIGVSVRLHGGRVEWRMRGETARIAHFLFPDTLQRIRTTVPSIQVLFSLGCIYRHIPVLLYIT